MTRCFCAVLHFIRCLL